MKTEPAVTTGDDSDGAIFLRQVIRPLPTLNAISSPVRLLLGLRLHGGPFMNVS